MTNLKIRIWIQIHKFIFKSVPYGSEVFLPKPGPHRHSSVLNRAETQNIRRNISVTIQVNAVMGELFATSVMSKYGAVASDQDQTGKGMPDFTSSELFICMISSVADP